MKEEALKLADEIDNFYKHHNEPYFLIQLQSMIRRLVEELDEKNYRILELTKRYKALTWNDEQTKPLSEDAIESIAFDYANEDGELDLTGFARAIEERHGIK